MCEIEGVRRCECKAGGSVRGGKPSVGRYGIGGSFSRGESLGRGQGGQSCNCNIRKTSWVIVTIG